MEYTHEHFMKVAINEAKKALEKDEVPIGAVLVIQNQIISKGFNQVEMLNDSTAHAEIIALTSAYSALGTKYLPEATLYVTIEPCLMCAGALYWGKVGTIVYGSSDDKNGYRRYVDKNPFHPKTNIITGIMADECRSLVQTFFKNKRQ
ncbi:MAG: nucleoside deaminase [Ginsengibacter sp.]